MDDADAADLTVEQHLQRALAVRRPTLAATGTCYGCEEAIEGELRFHNADCRDQYERRQGARARSGAR
jgi:hypothetical protein